MNHMETSLTQSQTYRASIVETLRGVLVEGREASKWFLVCHFSWIILARARYLPWPKFIGVTEGSPSLFGKEK